MSLARRTGLTRTGFARPTLAEFRAAVGVLAAVATRRQPKRIKLLVPAEGARESGLALRRWRAGLNRGKALPRRSKDRAKRARRFARQFRSAAFVEWIHARACAVPNCLRGPCEAAHARSRGAGGTADDVLALCGGPDGHHAEQHRIGVRSFEKLRGIILLDSAAEARQDWERRLLRDSL